MSDTLDEQRRAYQWYTGYDRSEEYNKNPQWALDIDTEEDEIEETEDYTIPTLRVYDKYDPEKIWIESDTTYDLTQCL